MPPLPWHQIDTVLLDMDGTLLDLHFDNHFWLTHLPQRYAEHHGVSLALAQAELLPLFRQHAGTLNWYCTDFWSRELRLSIRDLKREVAHLIAPRADAEVFLRALREAGKRVVLITNAHRDSLSLKMERVELAPWFERLISSHDYGFPRKINSSGSPCARTSTSTPRAACSSTTACRSCAAPAGSVSPICLPCASQTARPGLKIPRSSPQWRTTGSWYRNYLRRPRCRSRLAGDPG